MPSFKRIFQKNEYFTWYLMEKKKTGQDTKTRRTLDLNAQTKQRKKKKGNL